MKRYVRASKADIESVVLDFIPSADYDSAQLRRDIEDVLNSIEVHVTKIRFRSDIVRSDMFKYGVSTVNQVSLHYECDHSIGKDYDDEIYVALSKAFTKNNCKIIGYEFYTYQ